MAQGTNRFIAPLVKPAKFSRFASFEVKMLPFCDMTLRHMFRRHVEPPSSGNNLSAEDIWSQIWNFVMPKTLKLQIQHNCIHWPKYHYLCAQKLRHLHRWRRRNFTILHPQTWIEQFYITITTYDSKIITLLFSLHFKFYYLKHLTLLPMLLYIWNYI